MKYTVNELAKLSGVTKRTLRYYDEIGLLKPSRMNENGYRVYGPKEVDLLQQILFYRELGIELQTIQKILHSPGFSEVEALKDHREKLIARREKVNRLIHNVEKTLRVKEGNGTMSDQEKFEGFKERLIEDNEKKYGREIRDKFGDDQVQQSYWKIKNMTKEQYEKIENLSQEIMDTLKEAMETGDPGGTRGQKVAELHHKWLGFYWDHYTKEAHAGLAQMYVDDQRFTKYYDQVQDGAAEFLRDAIFIYTGMNGKDINSNGSAVDRG